MSWGGQELVGALVLFDLGVTESLLSGVTRGAGGGGEGGEAAPPHRRQGCAGHMTPEGNVQVWKKKKKKTKIKQTKKKNRPGKCREMCEMQLAACKEGGMGGEEDLLHRYEEHREKGRDKGRREREREVGRERQRER